jgi:peptide/nickel transport system ATP-binding protein
VRLRSGTPTIERAVEPGDTGSNGALLEVRNLRTSFMTARGPLQAVDGVSLTVGRGETLGIVGESGSGKSVLVRSIMNLVPRTATVEGTVMFEGRDIRSLSGAERKHFWGPHMSMIFQDPMTSLNPVKKIGQQLADPLRYHLGVSGKAAEKRALELRSLVRIPEAHRRLGQYPHELSGGMRQRVMIAIAVSCNPRLLLADEPTTALDVTVQKQILDLLGTLQRELDMAMILITHDLGVVAGRTKRIGVMYAGRIVEEASTSGLFAEVRHPYTEGLMASIPRIQEPSHTRLTGIPGRPPDMVEPPVGCRFAPRCKYVQTRCQEESPALLDVPYGHSYACFYPVGAGEGSRPVVGSPAEHHVESAP